MCPVRTSKKIHTNTNSNVSNNKNIEIPKTIGDLPSSTINKPKPAKDDLNIGNKSIITADFKKGDVKFPDPYHDAYKKMTVKEINAKIDSNTYTPFNEDLYAYQKIDNFKTEVSKFVELGKLADNILALPDNESTAKLKAKWLTQVSISYKNITNKMENVESEHERGGISFFYEDYKETFKEIGDKKDSKGNENPASTINTQYLFRKVFESDPSGIVNHFMKISVDPFAKVNFVPMLKTMLINEDFNSEKSNKAIAKIIGELSTDILNYNNKLDPKKSMTDEQEDILTYKCQALGYFMAGVESAIELKYEDKKEVIAAKKEFTVGIISALCDFIPEGGAIVGEVIVNPFVKKQFEKYKEEANKEKSKNIDDLMIILLKSIKADTHPSLKEHVMGQYVGTCHANGLEKK